MIFHIIFIFFAIIITLSSLLKLCELIIATIWVFIRGKRYRDRFVNEIAINNSNSHTIIMAKIINLDNEVKIQWPIIRKWILALKEKKSDWKSTLIGLFLNIIYRSPFLIGSLSILLICFVIFILPRNNQAKPVLISYIYITSILIISLMLCELAYDFFRRLFLGYVDNFREDFVWNVVKNYSKQNIIKWSKSEFVYKIVFSTIILSISFLIGFYALFLAIYKLDINSFRFDVGVNRISYTIQLAYFTIQTFATVGFGDIKPASALAQLAVSIEICCAVGIVILFLFTLSNTLSEK